MSHIRFETYHYQRSKDKGPQIEGKVLLDYDIEIHDLDQKDKIYYWEGTGSNYSLAGFELEFRRYKLQYIIQYYIPSGLFVVVSWVICYHINYLKQTSTTKLYFKLSRK